MIFTVYTNAAKFSADVLDVLKRQEIQNNLLIKNIGDGDNKTMLSVKDDTGNVLLVAIRTLPFPMVMYEVDNIRDDGVVNFFAQSLVDKGITVDFLMTEPELAKSFVRFYGEYSGKSFENSENLVLYVTDRVAPPPSVKGSLRQATEEDLHYLPYWCADFIPACNLGGYDLSGGIGSAQRAAENQNMYVWVNEHGQPVSMAAAVREVTDCRFLGQVYTPPQFRGNGYSTACVGELTRILLETYAYCALYADCANPFSNAVYRKIGYKELFWYSQYKVKTI